MTFVMKAIWEPKKRIAITFVLYIVLSYFFAVLAFTYFKDDVPEYNCQTMWRCLLVTFDQGFKNDGGLGGFLNSAYRKESGPIS